MKKLLVLAGPSAVGKTTVMKRLIDMHGEFELVRSATTREPRGDGHDSEYIYLSAEDFRLRIEEGQMLEFTEYGGNLYGTPLSETERIFAEGRIPLLILDINGVLSLKSITEKFKTVAVYITAEMDILDARLEARATLSGNSEAALRTLEKRKAQNRRDLTAFSQVSDRFDAVVKNESLDLCANQIYKIFSKST